jgi:hypothetical protein
LGSGSVLTINLDKPPLILETKHGPGFLGCAIDGAGWANLFVSEIVELERYRHEIAYQSTKIYHILGT